MSYEIDTNDFFSDIKLIYKQLCSRLRIIIDDRSNDDRKYRSWISS